ncbi:MAG: flagellar hook-basal body complex protein FliE [Hydrogenobaculum sp.]|jgi:flagellar hook-basal body complex protein FliE
MENKITSIPDLFANNSLEKPQKQKNSQGETFFDVLSNFLNYANDVQQTAEATKKAILEGADIPLHDAVVQFDKAGVVLNLLVQVRNKLLDAYQTLINTQV